MFTPKIIMRGSAALAALLWSGTSLAQAAGSSGGTMPISADTIADGKPDSEADQVIAIHGQATFVIQGNTAFRSKTEGTNSLSSHGEIRETADVTLFAGVKPWAGAEIWANPEIDQGFGLRNTLGLAGFASGEAYKVGKQSPYFKLHRLFARQTIALGGDTEKVDPDLNQLGGNRTVDRIVLTAGKFSVGDVFDTNAYAHDPRADFLNWSLIEAGSFDYAANAWGYTYGGSAELYKGSWTFRAGLFDLSVVPNDTHLQTRFQQYELVGEIEKRFALGGHGGKIKVTGYFNHGNMALLDAAVVASAGMMPDPVPVRRFASRPGVSANLEQEVSDAVGVFARAGVSDGRYEAFEFTDIDRSVSGGVSIKGNAWQRPNDRIGIAAAINHASDARRRFLDAGGLGILIGDGSLPHPGEEYIVEAYYAVAIGKAIRISLDAQGVANPAYNRDRGPLAIFAARLHAQF